GRSLVPARLPGRPTPRVRKIEAKGAAPHGHHVRPPWLRPRCAIDANEHRHGAPPATPQRRRAHGAHVEIGIHAGDLDRPFEAQHWHRDYLPPAVGVWREVLTPEAELA